MGKCKVCVHRLALVPGALGDAGGGEGEANNEDERRALDWEHHHQAMEVAAASSSVRHSHATVHGVESVLRGKFWAVCSDSESELDCEEVDQLSCALHKMSISSPTNLSSPESSASVTSHAAGVENSLRTKGLCNTPCYGKLNQVN
jgi:hypothetical protein